MKLSDLCEAKRGILLLYLLLDSLRSLLQEHCQAHYRMLQMESFYFAIGATVFFLAVTYLLPLLQQIIHRFGSIYCQQANCLNLKRSTVTIPKEN